MELFLKPRYEYIESSFSVHQQHVISLLIHGFLPVNARLLIAFGTAFYAITYNKTCFTLSSDCHQVFSNFFIFRYFGLIDKAIEPFMVSPVEETTLRGIFRFVPKSLRTCIPQATKNFLWVGDTQLFPKSNYLP